MALRSDQTVVVWGDLDEPPPGLGGVTAIASGHEHGLALRSGLLLPFIVQQPNSQYAWPGANLTLRVAAIALGDLTYQWQFNGVNISAATGTALAVANMQPSREGPYRVIVSNAAGSVTNSVAELALARPQIVSTTPPAPSTKSINTNFQMSVTVTVPLSSRQHPLGYQWFHDGAPIAGATNNYLWLYPPWTPPWQTNPVEGDYTVAVGNDAGTNQAGPWTIHYVSPLIPGAPAVWGLDDQSQFDYPGDLTNAVAIAAGYAHSVAATEDGQLRQWGEYGALGTFVPLVDPPSGSNYVAVAAGMEHDLALRADGTVVAWGLTNASANFVPTDLAPAKAIACGWDHSLALLTNGIVAAWGQAPMTNVPAGLSNVTAISANVFHSLALRGDGTVVAWGYDLAGETAVPPGLSNIVDIAAGATHNLALRADGTVCAWGDNSFGQTNVPAGLSNVMAVAAGFGHSVALKNDGTLVAWGDDEYGQTDVPITLTNGPVKLIAAGGQQTVAVLYSPLVQYPVDVTKDLLLIYNTNSLDS